VKGLPNQAPLKKDARPGRGHIVLGILVGILIGGGFAAGAAFYLTRSSPFQGNTSAESGQTASLPQAAVTPPLTPEAGPLPLPGKPGDPPVVKPQFDFYHLLPQGEKPPSPEIPPAAMGSGTLPPQTGAQGGAPSIVPPLPLPVPASPKPPPAALPTPTQAVAVPVAPLPSPTVSASSPSAVVSLPPPSSPPTLPAASSERYFLQAGAFNTASEAENLKARLALMGIQSSTQRADVPDRGVMHRVRIGPFPNMDELGPARSRLVDAGVNPTVIRVRPREP
jgi:cell division protein FtsN